MEEAGSLGKLVNVPTCQTEVIGDNFVNLEQCLEKAGKFNVNQTTWPLVYHYPTWASANGISIYYNHVSINNNMRKLYKSSLRFCKE